MNNRESNQQNRQELAWAQKWQESPAVIPTEEFDDETGNPVPKAIGFHSELLLLEEEEEEKQTEQEQAFHQLDRKDRNPVIITSRRKAIGIIDYPKPFGRKPIAAAAEEAADPAKGMSDGNRRENKIHHGDPLLADRVNQNEDQIE